MINLLDKLNASEKLRKQIEKSIYKVQFNDDKTRIKLLIDIDNHLDPISNIELYSKLNTMVENEIGVKFDGVEYGLEHTDDIIYIYENIREFIKWKKPLLNLSHIYVWLFKENQLIVSAARQDVFDQVFEIQNELSTYLDFLCISHRDVVISLDPNVFHEQKLNKIIAEEANKKFAMNIKKTQVHDETLKDGYNEIDFLLPNETVQRNVYYEGQVFGYEIVTAKNGNKIHKFHIGNMDKAISVTSFDKNGLFPEMNNGDHIRVYGIYEYDDFAKGCIFKIFTPEKSIQKISPKEIKKETIEHPRHEFHVHTKMSTLDGVSNVKDYVKYAEAYNIRSLTVTDHNTAQSFPDAYYASKGTDVIINYGVELDVYDDLSTEVVINNRDQEILDAEYVVFDLETTSVSAWLSEIIEFGAVKYKNGVKIETKQMFIKPSRDIDEFTTKLTSITNDDVKDAPVINDAIEEIKNWIGDAILVAHNASFDYGFLNKAYIEAGYGPLENPVIDSMKLSWFFHPNSKAHRLEALVKNELKGTQDLLVFKEEYGKEGNAHRADYDAKILGDVFQRLIHRMLKNNIRNLNQLTIENLNKYKEVKTLWSGSAGRPVERNYNLEDYYFARHITVISKNQDGLKDLNEIISLANIKYFNRRKKSPMIPLSFFINKEERLLKNVLVGSACSNGVLFDAILNADWGFAKSIIEIYDFVEIFPPSAYKHLIANHVINGQELKKVFKKIKELADEAGIPVIVTSNAHYADREEKEYRNILISASRVGGGFHPLHNFRNPRSEKPDNHLRNTSEIFEEFRGIFTEEEVFEITISNPQKIQDKISSDQKPIHDDLFKPEIPGAIENLKQSIDDEIIRLYGDNPHPDITERVHRELDPIINNGYGIIYYLSAVAVKKSNDDGYLVGSRGSVGSSLAATFSGITEVNPMDPHYRCPQCKYHEFDNSVDDGYDLPTKMCPVCQSKMIGDGHKIPFETFLGFNAEKVPDIDLNFSRDNQSDIHLYMKEVLGEENIFRAGTISTAAPKTAIGYVRTYAEMMNKNYSNATIEWLATKVEGSKRTTGQHPGGLIVIPNDRSVYEFTPINYPGDDANADWKTTHFDFHSIHDNLLKLDLLGHLDPSTVRMLQTLTGVAPQDIQMNDSEVISLFESNEALKYQENYTNEDLGILGIPEFGTNFVRGIVREAKPKSFADLVRISGLSHGTDVWANNAQKLIKDGTANLSEVICVRDDIMTYLIENGMDKLMSFDIMESVRKGKGLTPEWEHSMRDNNIPEWYIQSCKTIKYMFPKAHATAYVMMAFRISWYKINYPLEYYATYFSKRDVELDLSKVLKGIDEMKKHYQELRNMPKFERKKLEEDLIDTYLIIFEMYSRGIQFENIDINKSRSANYEINRETGKLIPPFSSISGVGELVAKSATDARREKKYISVSDFKQRSKLPKKVLDSLEELGVFDSVDDNTKEVTQQLSLFD